MRHDYTPQDDRARRRNAEVFWRALTALARQHPPGSLLLVRELRRHTPLNKRDFDQAALDLAEVQKVALHYHDFPHGPHITEADRHAWIFDPRGETQGRRGTYYMGIAPRD